MGKIEVKQINDATKFTDTTVEGALIWAEAAEGKYNDLVTALKELKKQDFAESIQISNDADIVLAKNLSHTEIIITLKASKSAQWEQIYRELNKNPYYGSVSYINKGDKQNIKVTIVQ